MKNITPFLIALLLVAPLTFMAQCSGCQNQEPSQTSNGINSGARNVFSAANTSYWISKDKYISYKWKAKPKIGENVLLVTVYSKGKKINTDLTVTANSYMPSMRGSHDTGALQMKLNKKNSYAIPVNLVMLGKWEIELKFSLNKSEIYTGYVQVKI